MPNKRRQQRVNLNFLIDLATIAMVAEHKKTTEEELKHPSKLGIIWMRSHEGIGVRQDGTNLLM